MKIKSKTIRYIEPKSYSCGIDFPGYYFCELILTSVTENIEEIKVNFKDSSLDGVEAEVDMFINKIK